MSSGEDNPFARWSRRKQAAKANEDRQPEREEPEPAEPEIDALASASVPEDAPPVLAEGDEAQEPLPRLEDLTAESDLSAFLRKGVPEALKSAAMRRMWSLDPSIRDYVGPAEYAWDFNQSGSMRGFGALDPGEVVVDFLSRAAPAAVGDEDEGTPASGAELSPQAEVSADPEASAKAYPAADAGDPQPAADEQTTPPPEGVEVADGRTRTADTSPASADRPRHGGAMPN